MSVLSGHYGHKWIAVSGGAGGRSVRPNHNVLALRFLYCLVLGVIAGGELLGGRPCFGTFEACLAILLLDAQRARTPCSLCSLRFRFVVVSACTSCCNGQHTARYCARGPVHLGLVACAPF